MDNDILRSTTKHFDNINFSEMHERWIDDAIESEFTDVEDNPMSIGILFTDDPIKTLLNISRVCDAWVIKASQNGIEESHTGDISTRPEEVLWTYLDQMEIRVKQIQGVIYFLCCKAVKTSSSLEEKEIGLLSAKWYFNCLRVPGSTAYSVFYPNLFRVCIDCLQVPDHVESKDSHYKWRDFEKILPTFALTLDSLVPLLGVFHLGTDTSTVDYVIKKLSDLVASEVSNSNLNFDMNFLAMPEKERRRRYSNSLVTASLAYQGFTTLISSDLNGEKEYMYSTILSSLSRHILCTRIKAGSISAKFAVIKDNAVSFICYNLKDKDEISSQLTLTALKRLCLSVTDRTEFRGIVAHAVFNIMFHLQIQDLAGLIQWLLLLVDAAETNNRAYAVEMLGQLLTNIPQVDTEGLPEAMEVYLTPVPVIFAILTRCDDISPNVRNKALSILSQHMTRALNVLTEIQEPAIFSGEVFEDDFECNMNGDHRSFWYNFASFKDMLSEISTIFRRRVEDNNSFTRKAALQALESVITFDVEYLSKDNLKLFTTAAIDGTLIVRKQTVQSLSVILEKYPNNSLSQEYWLKCVLPLIQDPESNVQAKVLNLIEEKFLCNVFSDNDAHQDAAFSLLRKMSSGEFMSHQRYLQKAFGYWKTEKKLRPQMATKLERSFGHGNDEMIWLYLSIFSAFSKLPSKICQLAVVEFEKPLNWESSSMENILKVIGCTFSNLDPDQMASVKGILMEKLEAYAAPVEILPIMIEILCSIEKHLDRQNEFSEFAAKMTQSSVDILSPFVSLSKVTNVSSEDLAIKSFTVIKEFCHMFPANITPNLTILLKQFVYPTFSANSASASTEEKVTTTLQAHAFAALGKVSLQEENLASDIIPFLAKELKSSNEDRIRNNIVIILIEMCKRYTSFADKYIPLISECFIDKRYIIRYQSITLIAGLLQEDYIKCKGTLLYCLLSTIIDKKETIQELGKYCLLQLLFTKNNSIFADHFVDSIFVFNHYPPPDNDRLANIVRQLDRFALVSDAHREQRMQIFKFMLIHAGLPSRAYIVGAVCQEILASVADSVFDLEEATECMVKDCFAILGSKEIRCYDSEVMVSEVEENEEENVVTAELSARLETLVKPIIPVVISLKACVWDSKTELLTDMVLFLKDLLQDFKGEVNELLKDDKDLLRQVQFEMTNEARQQEKEAKAKSRREAKSNKGAEVSTHQKLEQLIQRDRDSLNVQGSDAFAAGPASQLSRRAMRKSAAANEMVDFNDDVLMSIGSSSSDLSHPFRNDPLLSSTPHVVLKPLGKFDLPNISRIMMEEDDSD